MNFKVTEMLGFKCVLVNSVRQTCARSSTTFRRRILSQKFQNREIKSLSNGLQPASAHISSFQKLLGVDNVLTDSFDIEKYTVDWTRVFRGGSVVCMPCSTEDVSNILRYCNDNKIGVVPQGGNTGLVGGSVGLSGENGDQLIISMEKMKTIHSIEDSVLICDAGCILETLNTACVEKGYIVPLDLGAKGACMIGGNVATNAGGLRVVRYGTLHGNVLGLEVVQADGTVLDMLRTLKKDNCGYHLPHLFIGSEGTLGIITKVAVTLALKPSGTAVVWVKVSYFSTVHSQGEYGISVSHCRPTDSTAVICAL
jgi:FAD/FMN-containing dehydrogenase